MREKYVENPKLHLQHLHAFNDHLKTLILGEEDQQWRRELQFVKKQTGKKIKEVKDVIYMKDN